MSVIRVGSNSGYAAGWEAIFGGGRKAKATGAAKRPRTAAQKPAKAKVKAVKPAKKPAAIRKAKNRRRK